MIQEAPKRYEQVKFEATQVQTEEGTTVVFDVQTEARRKDEARKTFRNTARTIAPMFYAGHRRGTGVILPTEEREVTESYPLRLAFRSLADLAARSDFEAMREAGFANRKQFYDQSLRWVGEVWTEAAYGDAAMDFIRNSGDIRSDTAKEDFEKDVQFTQQILKDMTNFWGFYPPPPLRDEGLEQKLDEKFGPLPAKETKVVWQE